MQPSLPRSIRVPDHYYGCDTCQEIRRRRESIRDELLVVNSEKKNHMLDSMLNTLSILSVYATYDIKVERLDHRR